MITCKEIIIIHIKKSWLVGLITEKCLIFPIERERFIFQKEINYSHNHLFVIFNLGRIHKMATNRVNQQLIIINKYIHCCYLFLLLKRILFKLSKSIQKILPPPIRTNCFLMKKPKT